MSGRHVFPLSFAQQRLLFLDQLDPGKSAYNLTRVIRMVGPLDSGVLTQTLNRLVTRHASLRTRFVFEAETGYQIVEDGFEFQLPVLGQRFLGSNHIRRRRQVCMTKCG